MDEKSFNQRIQDSTWTRWLGRIKPWWLFRTINRTPGTVNRIHTINQHGIICFNIVYKFSLFNGYSKHLIWNSLISRRYQNVSNYKCYVLKLKILKAIKIFCCLYQTTKNLYSFQIFIQIIRERSTPLWIDSLKKRRYYTNMWCSRLKPVHWIKEIYGNYRDILIICPSKYQWYQYIGITGNY